VVEAADSRGLARPWRVDDFVAVTGRGARARLDGAGYEVGRPSDEAAIPATIRGPGRSVVALTAPEGVAGWIALADRPREAAREVLSELRALGIRRTVMLTGDSPDVAALVGEGLDVDEVRGGLLPADKVTAVRELESRLGRVAMVGDGVNDAPALAAATVGVAMGAAGSDTALETADIALMGDDLSRLPYLLALSRQARRVIRQNVAAAILVKAILAVGVPLGFVSLITAVVIGDMGVSLAVTLNALRLAGVRP
jgi:Cd2+/Zn2+-exporting ATPase